MLGTPLHAANAQVITLIQRKSLMQREAVEIFEILFANWSHKALTGRNHCQSENDEMSRIHRNWKNINSNWRFKEIKRKHKCQ